MTARHIDIKKEVVETVIRPSHFSQKVGQLVGQSVGTWEEGDFFILLPAFGFPTQIEKEAGRHS